MVNTVRVRLSQRNFGTGLKYAKRVNGQYDPNTRTWLIPADRPELGAPGAYGWLIVPEEPAFEPQPPFPPIPAPSTPAQPGAAALSELVARRHVEPGAVDGGAVEAFCAGADAYEYWQRAQIVLELSNELKRGYNRYGHERCNFATLAAIVDRIASMDQEQS